MLVRGRLARPLLLPPGDCECKSDWLGHPLVVAHCRPLVDLTHNADPTQNLEVAGQPVDTMVFRSLHALDMSLVDVDHV